MKDVEYFLGVTRITLSVHCLHENLNYPSVPFLQFITNKQWWNVAICAEQLITKTVFHTLWCNIVACEQSVEIKKQGVMECIATIMFTLINKCSEFMYIVC